MPASSTGSQARVSYYAQLTASYKTEDRDSELGSREVFSVLAELDLNLLPEVFKVSEQTEQRVFMYVNSESL